MTVDQWIERVLVGHPESHLGSIGAAVEIPTAWPDLQTIRPRIVTAGVMSSAALVPATICGSTLSVACREDRQTTILQPETAVRERDLSRYG